MTQRFIFSLLILITGLGPSTGCLTSPIVRVVGDPDIRKPPKIGERVEVLSSQGLKLRGLYVSAGKEAPLVLYFLPSGASITKGLQKDGLNFPMTKQLRMLREEGFSSFIIDYRGVGASEGSAIPETIPQDAELIWAEALKLVSNQPNRVVVRSASLGTLASISLMEKFRPAGISLVAPIQPQTINRNVFRHFYGGFLAVFLDLLYQLPTQQNLVKAIQSTSVPLLITLPKEDVFLPQEEAKSVQEAFLAKGGTTSILTEDHSELVLNYIGWKVLHDGEGGFSLFYGEDLVQGEMEFFKKVLRMEQ